MGEWRAVVGGCSTRVLDEGSGPAVVLVHATPFDLDYWDGLSAFLGVDHRVIRYDLPGHGAADDVVGLTAERLTRGLIDLLDVLELPTVHIVGHSFGALVGQHCALDHPERVRRLSLLGPRASPSAPFAALAAALRQDVAVTDSAMSRWFEPHELVRPGPEVRYVRSRVDGIPIPVWASALDLLAGADLLEQLPRLSMPVDVIVGEEDFGAHPDHARAVADAVPHARLHVVARAGVLLSLKNPGLVASLLR